jgi:hypothetical protein
LNTKKLRFEKPTRKDLLDIMEGAITVDSAQLLLEQIEELCLIIIEQHADRQKV